MDEILIRAACPENAADIAEIATQPQVVWGRWQLPAQTVAGWPLCRLTGDGPAPAGHGPRMTRSIYRMV